MATINSESLITYNVTNSDALPDTTEQDIINAAIVVLAKRLKQRPQDVFESSQATKHYVRLALAGECYETFLVLFLDSHNRMIKCETLATGTIGEATVHVRNVAKRALELNAASVIFAHNHPSGCTTASNADIAITRRLTTALKIFEIRVLDHLIVGDSVVSLAETGQI